MAEILSSVSIISFVIAAICFVLAVVVWFVFDIPTVIGDLSGRTARKSIAKMRENNEKVGKKSYRTSATNVERGKLTDTMPDSDKLNRNKRKKKAEEVNLETGILADNKEEVYEEQQTALLTATETTCLLSDEEETASLTTEENEPAKRVGGKKLLMLDDVMLVHVGKERL